MQRKFAQLHLFCSCIAYINVQGSSLVSLPIGRSPLSPWPPSENTGSCPEFSAWYLPLDPLIHSCNLHSHSCLFHFCPLYLLKSWSCGPSLTWGGSPYILVGSTHQSQAINALAIFTPLFLCGPLLTSSREVFPVTFYVAQACLFQRKVKQAGNIWCH